MHTPTLYIHNGRLPIGNELLPAHLTIANQTISALTSGGVKPTVIGGTATLDGHLVVLGRRSSYFQGKFFADLLDDHARVKDIGVHEIHDGDPVGVADRQVFKSRL